MDNNLEIDKMITISTGHIKEDTALALEREVKYGLNEVPLSIYNKAEFGWFIFVPDKNELIPEEEFIPNDLLDCINFAIKYDCKWLCLDCDGLIVPDLKTYDWS